MGSFCASCAVSNLPIESGEEVLWIYVKKAENWLILCAKK